MNKRPLINLGSKKKTRRSFFFTWTKLLMFTWVKSNVIALKCDIRTPLSAAALVFWHISLPLYNSFALRRCIHHPSEGTSPDHTAPICCLRPLACETARWPAGDGNSSATSGIAGVWDFSLTLVISSRVTFPWSRCRLVCCTLLAAHGLFSAQIETLKVSYTSESIGTFNLHTCTH